MKSFSRLLLPWLSPAAAAWQGAAEAIEGPENAHKYRKKITLTLFIAGFLHYLQNEIVREIQAVTPQISPAARDQVSFLP